MPTIRRFKVLEQFRHYGLTSLIHGDNCGYIMRRSRTNSLTNFRTYTVGQIVEMESPHDEPRDDACYWVPGAVFTPEAIAALLKEGMWEEIDKDAPT